MQAVKLEQLENRIIRPGFEKHLLPLIQYKGNVTLGRAHRCWNLLVSAKEQECERMADITQRLQHNDAFSHLCGPDKKMAAIGIQSFASRVIDNPKVAAEEPGLLDYCRSIVRFAFKLERVDEISHRRRNLGAGGWRTYQTLKRAATHTGNIKPVSAPLVYPFLIHDAGRPEHAMLRRVLAAVPRGMDPDVKADLCQDIIVGLLTGDFTEGELEADPKRIIKIVGKTYPTKYGQVSLDDFIPGTTIKRIDTISDDAFSMIE